jgi:hypothetical protein
MFDSIAGITVLNAPRFEREMRVLRKRTQRILRLLATVPDSHDTDEQWRRLTRFHFLVLGLTTPAVVTSLVTQPTRQGPSLSPELILNLISEAAQEAGISPRSPRAGTTRRERLEQRTRGRGRAPRTLDGAATRGMEADMTRDARTPAGADTTMPERAALIAALMVERPMCVGCIVTKTGIAAPAISMFLHLIDRTLTLRHHPEDRCRACGTVGEVFFFERPTT